MGIDDPPKGYQAPAVSKAFQLLGLVAESEHGLGISELAQHMGYSKSTIHGLTQALMASGAILQSPVKKKFFLGPAIMDLAVKNRHYGRMVEKSQPWLDRLRDDIGESVFLGVLTQTRSIIIATSEPAKPLKISSPAGTSIPVLAGAVGKIFLSTLDKTQARMIIKKNGMRRFTDNSMVDEREYFEELDRVRIQGYALDNEEYMQGVKAVAMNLGVHRGLRLALWVVGFANTLGPKILPMVIQSMQATVTTLNAELQP